MRIRELLALLLFFPLALAGVEDANSNMFELPNGLKVIFNPASNVEATAVCLYFLNGSRNDPPDMPGVSGFFQDLLFQGTANLEPLDHVLFVTQRGGVIGGRVNHDNTFFYQVVPATDLPIALRYESERLRSLKIDNPTVEAEKRQVLARIQRFESSITQRARQWVLQYILAGSGYDLPVHGDADKVRMFWPDRVRDFYKHYQNCSNLILVVCGRFDVSALRSKVNDYFQDIPGGYRSRSTFAAQPLPEKAAVYKNWLVEGLARPQAIYAFPAPARLNLDYFYFEFIRCYLGGERISRLDYVFNQVNDLGIEVHTQLTDYFESNAFLIELTAPDRTSLEKAKYLLAQELGALQTASISGSEMRMTKNYMEVAFLKEIQALEVQAQRIAEYYHMFGGLDFLSSYLGRIRKIDAYDIRNMAKKYLGRERQVVLNVLAKK